MFVLPGNKMQWLTVTLLLCQLFARGQKTDTLKEARVTAKPGTTGDLKISAFSPGQKVIVIDSLTLQQYRMQSVASLLSQQLPVFIKSYSFNGLSTLSFRGASAAQSQVLWNGVPIQNAALGIADISALPVMFMSHVNVVYGGSAALFGSGNVGGALLLDNGQPTFGSGKVTLSASGAMGSFRQESEAIALTASGKKWYVSLKGLLQAAQNDFPYTDDTGSKHNTANSASRSGAVMLHAAYKTGAQSVLSLSAWLQQYNREIPPATFEAGSSKKQSDASVRLLLGWDRQTAKSTWYAKSSFIKDDIRYDDAPIGLHTVSTANQYYQEAGWRAKGNRVGQWVLFVPMQLAWMQEPLNHETRQQARLGLAGAYALKLLSGRLTVAANARAEAIDGKGILLPGADASLAITKWLTLRANVQRTYRTPSLNELYYYPGGNANLKPEQGWSEDAGYTAKAKLGRATLYHDLSAYSRNIKDWIIWIGGAIFTPHNIAEVHSRGIETENKLEYSIKKWKLHLGVGTSYTLATTVSSYIPNDGSIGKQIPYTPRYNGRLNIGCSYKRLYINYNHSYTGYRFKFYDESDYLLPYQAGNLQLMYTALIKKHDLQLTAQCNNIWNSHYEIIAQRPMPGTNWLAGFRLGVF
jgi:iron complex outermembrane receptor protein